MHRRVRQIDNLATPVPMEISDNDDSDEGKDFESSEEDDKKIS